MLAVACLALAGDDGGAAAARAAGAGSADDPYLIPATERDIRIDGNLEPAEWRDALVLTLDYETDPGENSPAPVRTELLLTYDEGQLYAAFRCLDPEPGAIRGYLCDRERFGGDDQVALHLDTFDDRRRNFTFGVNACGVQLDGVATLGRGTDTTWDAIWDSAGKIHDWGYAVELAVPFNQLSFPRGERALVWGLNAQRRYPRNVSHLVSLVPLDRDDSCWQCQFARVRGFAGARPGHAVEITPTLTTVRTDARDPLPGGDFQLENEETEFGLNLKWGLTSSLTANGTYNPDFSQVEADALQLDINQPFALWYPERRPFFTEGAHFFDTLKDVVYTRTLRDPVWGAKLTGKEGIHGVGAYVVRDDLTNLLLPGSQGSRGTSLDRESTAGVLRYRRDVGERSTLGAMVTGREGGGYRNGVLGLDADLRLTARDQIQLQALASRTEYPDAVVAGFGQPRGDFAGEMLAFEYDHDARSAYWWLDLERVDREFRADLGFIPQVGYRNVEGGAFGTWYGEESWWNRLQLGWDFRIYEELDGALLERGGSLWGYYRGDLDSWLQASLDRSRQVYAGREYDLTAGYLSCGFEPSGVLEAWVSLAVGDRIDYDNGRLGSRLRLDPGLSLRMGRHLRLDLQHRFERLTVDPGRLYRANISYLAAVYQLNVRLFVRAILQRVHYDRNADLYLGPVNPETTDFYSQLLLSYKINPRTALYLGYDDSYSGTQDWNLTQARRTLFAKVGYAWGL